MTQEAELLPTLLFRSLEEATTQEAELLPTLLFRSLEAAMTQQAELRCCAVVRRERMPWQGGAPFVLVLALSVSGRTQRTCCPVPLRCCCGFDAVGAAPVVAAVGAAVDAAEDEGALAADPLPCWRGKGGGGEVGLGEAFVVCVEQRE